MTTRRANRRVIATTAVATIVAGLFLAAFGAATAPAGATPQAKVVICHATSAKTNPYQEIEVNVSSLDGNGGNDHTGHTGPVFDFTNPAANTSWGDIVPPFGTFGGLNWDAAGQAVHGAGCAPVALELCEFDAGLTADDAGCVPPVEPEVCEFDPDLTADDPTCTASVENEVVNPPTSPPTTAAPSGDTGSPDGDVPSDGGSSSDQVVAPGTVARGPLPRTGGEHRPLVTVALILILLGVGTLIAQRATPSTPRGAHFAP